VATFESDIRRALARKTKAGNFGWCPYRFASSLQDWLPSPVRLDLKPTMRRSSTVLLPSAVCPACRSHGRMLMLCFIHHFRADVYVQIQGQRGKLSEGGWSAIMATESAISTSAGLVSQGRQSPRSHSTALLAGRG